MPTKSIQRLQKYSKKTKQHNHINTKKLTGAEAQNCACRLFIVKGIKSYYNYKTKATSLFLPFTACNLLPQAQALRFALCQIPLCQALRFGKRYKQTNGGRCGGVSWSPKKSERKKGKKANGGWLFLFAEASASCGKVVFCLGSAPLFAFGALFGSSPLAPTSCAKPQALKSL